MMGAILRPSAHQCLEKSLNDLIGKEAYPEDGDSQASNQRKESDSARIFLVVWVLKWEENDQSQPDDSKSGGQAEFGSFGIGSIKDLVERNDKETKQCRQEFQVYDETRAKINRER